MKKFLALTGILLLLLSTHSFAQSSSCARVTDANYVSCCSGVGQYTNADSCRLYRDAVATFGTFNSSTTPATTNPRTTTPATNPLNGSAQQNASIFDTPQAGSAELQQCSKIQFKSILDILIWIKCIIGVAIIPIIFGLATVFFLWGVLKYIRASDSKNREEAQKTIWAGLLGLFVMVSLWGIISIFGTIFGTGSAVPLLQTTYLK